MNKYDATDYEPVLRFFFNSLVLEKFKFRFRFR